MNLLFIRIKLFILLSYARLKGKVINIWKSLSSNQTKVKDPESSIDEVSEISVIEEEEYISLFLDKSANSPIYMPRPTLLKIVKALPENYVFPSPDANNLMKDELEKTRKEIIDPEIMDRIQKQLPFNYSIHNPLVFNNNPLNLNSLVSNSTVHGQILNNLPPDYKLS